ncbi:MAG TPA: bifunctional helix-turn-helix transcriptional regulator/GNAT family N-acetyltransferase, partial [Paracoccaceae bacterium]|nr:bifunctional helix-turn-helix transcriptional regulator/GNAT family N-acetyltransferase [Paracoccaceae bacterium]
PGYLSRLLTGFEAEGLVERSPAPGDGRQSLFELTAAGRAAFAPLDAASAASVGALLGRLDGAGRAALIAAAETVETLLSRPLPPVEIRTHRPGDLGWMQMRHAEIYRAEFGFGAEFEAIVAGICARFLEGYDPARERCWVAERAGVRLGCVALVQEDAETARLRLLLVEPAARGMGLGTRLVRECVETARAMGYRRLVLWTKDMLVAARRIYEAQGFRLVGESASADFGFAHADQTWAREL